ncbi:hypothetical protein GLAREA_11510 [Glarea lozoyensis ATCC 20868]|uniref:Uncharacterized protein n=1 Tax=Glarea lozoyensis (strain ATCC 20868 / MF5171) TaxID=1116229 RepID=S3CI37_GLAL2|nr:uncharacterized protein GLAREA_11510 [Glarea lozoyensis ATCC 20868]EPE24929.1 hypothetical protein GLAREA_11510 [Glarea lozoyensis ATCC 20868]
MTGKKCGSRAGGAASGLDRWKTDEMPSGVGIWHVMDRAATVCPADGPHVVSFVDARSGPVATIEIASTFVLNSAIQTKENDPGPSMRCDSDHPDYHAISDEQPSHRNIDDHQHRQTLRRRAI